jgi:hypothetical protein
MRSFILVAAICALTGCTTVPPLADTFWSINKETYVLGSNDCSNKSAKYARALIQAGYESDIVLLDTGTGGVHAVTRVVVNGERLYCDVTNGKWSKDSIAFGSPWLAVPYHRRNEWSPEFEVNYDDVQKHSDKHRLFLGDVLQCSEPRCIVNKLEEPNRMIIEQYTAEKARKDDD